MKLPQMTTAMAGSVHVIRKPSRSGNKPATSDPSAHNNCQSPMRPSKSLMTISGILRVL
jgi:hypothetical protein